MTGPRTGTIAYFRPAIVIFRHRGLQMRGALFKWLVTKAPRNFALDASTRVPVTIRATSQNDYRRCNHDSLTDTSIRFGTPEAVNRLQKHCTLSSAHHVSKHATNPPQTP